MDKKQKYKDYGCLFVITGASGAGKDSIMDGLINHPSIKSLSLKKVVTCTDRHPRPGEINGVHYHFVTKKKLQIMESKGKLAEKITPTGLSNKATPLSEVKRLLTGEDLIWRIDPSRAAEVATGDFFRRNLPKYASILQEQTLVLCVTAPKEIIENRRKTRDGQNFNPNDYKKRDLEEFPHLQILQDRVTLIENVDGHLQESIDLAVQIITSHHAKIKNKK